MKRLILALSATALLASAVLAGCAGASAGNGNHAKDEAALQNLLNDQIKQQNIPGMIMAVRMADGTVVSKTAGSADPSGKVPWTLDTVSAIGSITKTFTAVVVMQLVEEKKLSLDDTVDNWFPEQPNGDRITIRMLLSHTSGVANYSAALGDDVEKWTRDWTPEELIAEANRFGPVSEPGSKEAHYSNTGYYILGLVVEKITGKTWEQEVESRIIRPLGLERTTFLGKEGVWGGIMVSGYAKTPNGYISTSEFPWYPSLSTAWAAGAIVSSPSDLMTFASALFDGKLVSKATLAVMAKPLGKDVETGIMWGLGGGTVEALGPNAYGMGGDIPGYHAFFAGYLDTRLAVVAMVNTEEGGVLAPGLAALQYARQKN